MQQSRKFTAAAGAGKQTVWQVMQYEGLLGKLQDAIQESNAPEAQKILQVSHVAYNQLKDSGAADALLETGQYDAATRGRVCERFVGQFCKADETDTEEVLGRDNLMSYDPFYGVNYSVKMAPAEAKVSHIAQEVHRQPPPRIVPAMPKLPSFQDALNNKQLCRMNTSDASDIKPLQHFLRRDSPQELCTVLQLRGGGLLDGCYGSCGTNPCGTKTSDRASKRRLSTKSAIKAHERVKHSWAAQVNAFLDEPVMAFTLISIDLFSDLINMVLPWVMWFWIGLVALCLVLLQQVLEIYLHSSLVKKEIMLLDEVVAVISFWADNGENHPIRINVGQTGIVDCLVPADWRDDTGAMITFENDTLCFVSELDFEDLEITSGLYEYFSNPMNIFNCLILAMVFTFEVGLIPSNGAGPFLIALRFLKPTLRLYSRKNKMAEFHEKASGEEGEEEEGKAPMDGNAPMDGKALSGERVDVFLVREGPAPQVQYAPRKSEVIGTQEHPAPRVQYAPRKSEVIGTQEFNHMIGGS